MGSSLLPVSVSAEPNSVEGNEPLCYLPALGETLLGLATNSPLNESRSLFDSIEACDRSVIINDLINSLSAGEESEQVMAAYVSGEIGRCLTNKTGAQLGLCNLFSENRPNDSLIEAIVASLQETLSAANTSLPVKTESAKALGTFSKHADNSTLKTLLQALGTVGNNDLRSLTPLRDNITYAALKIAETIEFEESEIDILKTFLSGTDDDLRLRAIHLLGKGSDAAETSVDTLIDCLLDSNLTVRDAAYNALQEIKIRDLEHISFLMDFARVEEPQIPEDLSRCGLSSGTSRDMLTEIQEMALTLLSDVHISARSEISSELKRLLTLSHETEDTEDRDILISLALWLSAENNFDLRIILTEDVFLSFIDKDSGNTYDPSVRLLSLYLIEKLGLIDKAILDNLDSIASSENEDGQAIELALSGISQVASNKDNSIREHAFQIVKVFLNESCNKKTYKLLPQIVYALGEIAIFDQEVITDLLSFVDGSSQCIDNTNYISCLNLRLLALEALEKIVFHNSSNSIAIIDDHTILDYWNSIHEELNLNQDIFLVSIDRNSAQHNLFELKAGMVLIRILRNLDPIKYAYLEENSRQIELLIDIIEDVIRTDAASTSEGTTTVIGEGTPGYCYIPKVKEWLKCDEQMAEVQ